MKNRIAVVLVLLAAVLGLGIAAVLGWLIVRRSAVPKIASTPVIVQQIQSLSELVTVKFILEKVVAYDDPKFFADLIPLGDNKLILLLSP